MAQLRIKGGNALQGTIKSAGAKNAITKMLVASFISDKPCRFTNVPNISDVDVTVALCRAIGAQINWDKAAGLLEIHTPHLATTYIPQRFSGANRIPILMMGALLGRCREDVIIPAAGGCKIGQRPVDFHIEALQKLGANIEYRNMIQEGAWFAQAHSGLKGTVIELPYPSVGATENTILAAIRAEGTTVIKNAAVEPEIIDLVLFLQKMGAYISIDVSRTIRIKGTNTFYEVEHAVLPDRLEIASFAMAAIATKGKVFVENARHEHLMGFLNRLREIGAEFSVHANGIEFAYTKPLQGGIHVETGVYPSFSTDWQQPFVAMLTQAKGASIVHETVYENRFGYTKTLVDMGADIELFNQCLGSKPCRFLHRGFQHSLVVKGPTPLKAREIQIPDLRAGFAYVMAALMAEGTSTLTGLEFLDRGYENIEAKLRALGADIERTPQHAIVADLNLVST